MAILRAIRFLCVPAVIAVLVLGVASMLQGEWSRVGLSVGGFFVAMLVFAVAQNGIERGERGDVAALLGGVEAMLAIGDWQGALARTTQATALLSKSVKAVGQRSDQVGPLASTLVMHSVVLGGNGDIDGAQMASSRAIRILEKVPNPTHHAVELLENAREIEDGLRSCHGNSTAAMHFCRSMA